MENKIKTLKQVENKTSIIKLIEYKDKKFRMTYDNRNGTPLGFDYRFKTEILKEDVWVTIAGKNDISFKEISYVSDKVKLLEDSKKFFLMMEEHILLLY